MDFVVNTSDMLRSVFWQPGSDAELGSERHVWYAKHLGELSGSLSAGGLASQREDASFSKAVCEIMTEVRRAACDHAEQERTCCD